MKNSLHNVNNMSEIMIMNEGIVCCSTSDQEGFQVDCRFVVS